MLLLSGREALSSFQRNGPPIVGFTGHMIRNHQVHPMSAITRFLAVSLIPSLLITILASTPGWAEPASVIADGSQVAFGDSLLGEWQSEPLAVVVITPQGSGGEPPAGIQPAKSMALLYVGPRYGVGGDSPLGEEQKEYFQMYDIAALWSLPWDWRHRSSGWGLESRLITSMGELRAAGKNSLMSTLVPALALTSPNGMVALDLGLGLGFFSNYKFGVQNFGGPVQIVGTAGVGFTPTQKFRAGYRFQHFSDAGTYGPTSIGVDMHILEIGYSF